jgi:cytochrome c553
MAVRWIFMNLARAAAVVAGLALVAAASIFALSEWKLHRRYSAPLLPLAALTPDPAEGMRLAKIVGCWAGCHGMRGEGGTEDIEGIVRHTAPTLSEVLPSYSDEELVRLIRFGVKRDGRSAVGMTSFVFWPLSDQDLVDIIAHLRRQPTLPPIPRKLELPFRGRLAIATGEWNVSAEQVDRSQPRWGERPRNTSYERGRYYASITCAECHGVTFDGNRLEKAPSLAIVTAYTREQFRDLLRTGVPISGRDLGIMSWVSREAFSLFTDNEIDDLYTFLTDTHGR